MDDEIQTENDCGEFEPFLLLDEDSKSISGPGGI